MLNDFIWNGKNPKFRKKIMKTPISDGGLGTNMRNFDASLKLSWLRRIQQQDRGRAEFPYPKIVLYGDAYADRMAKKMKINSVQTRPTEPAKF